MTQASSAVSRYVQHVAQKSEGVFGSESNETICMKLLLYNLFPNDWEAIIRRHARHTDKMVNRQIEFLKCLRRFNGPSNSDWWQFLCLLLINGRVDPQTRYFHSHRNKRSERPLSHVHKFIDAVQKISEDTCCPELVESVLPLFVTAVTTQNCQNDVTQSKNFLLETKIGHQVVTGKEYIGYRNTIRTAMANDALLKTEIQDDVVELFSMGVYNQLSVGFDLRAAIPPAVSKETLQKEIKALHAQVSELYANSDLDRLEPTIRSKVCGRVGGLMEGNVNEGTKNWLKAEKDVSEKCVGELLKCQMTEEERVQKLRVSVKGEYKTWKQLCKTSISELLIKSNNGWAVRGIGCDVDNLKEAELNALRTDIRNRTTIVRNYQPGAVAV